MEEEATPDDQASDHSDEDDDLFIKTRGNSTDLTQLDDRDDDSHAMDTGQAAVLRNKHTPVSWRCMKTPVQCSWAYLQPNGDSHWQHQL